MGVHISLSEFPNTLSDQGDISEFNSFLFILKKKYEIISIISEISSIQEETSKFSIINRVILVLILYHLHINYTAFHISLFSPSTMVKRSSYKSNSSDNPDRVRKNSNMRDRSTINRMHMYREGKAKYDRNGKVIGGYLRSSTKTANKEIEGPARIAPNRKWFGNTRTITPEKLDTFREEMAKTVNDPYVECEYLSLHRYSVVLKTKVLPMSLITDSSKVERMNLLTTESFQSTFGPDKRRKRYIVRWLFDGQCENIIDRFDEFGLGRLKEAETARREAGGEAAFE